MKEEQLSPEQSLHVIQHMISKAKQDYADRGIYFLVWGWITFIACVGQFILKRIIKFEHHYIVWSLVIVGVVFSVWYGLRSGRKQKTRTYIGDSMKYLWIGLGICYFVLSFILSNIGWDQNVFPFYIMLYGLGTFVSGKLLQFRPLIVGGEVAFGLALGSIYVEYDFQILFAAAAILVSYIIPAYLFRSKRKFATQ